ncbi:hypothetical protein CAPI_01675 [Corynebacterium capitovis DSM 44611]|uniref:LppP/LprE family lipoprotein n=1 Tax=Corynebacterium capitovis TaxID=131081 RepID=UPI000377AD3C|nr:LppP/LprE family lipoprotein [Corynebacterium capitovis]WKD56909.1 hypothetical protein CAPI_01675 [Corynebacterium capitovis DSM 44611]
MARFRDVNVTAVLVACALVASCSDNQSEQQAQPASSATSASRTESSSQSSGAATGASMSDEGPSTEATPPATCDSAATNPLSRAGSLPIVSGGGQEFFYSVTDDHFNPCADLSWSVVAGGVGTGNSLREGVVFFHRGSPISEPAPLMEERVTAVTRRGNDAVTVSYEILEDPRAAGQTTPGLATFTLTAQGSLVVSENTLPHSANAAGIQLDVSQL